VVEIGAVWGSAFFHGMAGRRFTGGCAALRRAGFTSRPQKDPPIERVLPFSLEELYKGCTRKMKISRNIYDASSGKSVPVQEILTIDVKPGWKKGTKLTFAEKGRPRSCSGVAVKLGSLACARAAWIAVP
jgi:DnaJ homolog subfamily B member 4